MRSWVFGLEGFNVLLLVLVLFVLAQPTHAQETSAAVASTSFPEPLSWRRDCHWTGGHRIGDCRRHCRRGGDRSDRGEARIARPDTDLRGPGRRHRYLWIDRFLHHFERLNGRPERFVVIGDEDAVFGLGLIGLEGRAVTSVEQAREAIRKAMSDPDTALVLLTENWSEARPGVDGRIRRFGSRNSRPGAGQAIARARGAHRASLGRSFGALNGGNPRRSGSAGGGGQQTRASSGGRDRRRSRPPCDCHSAKAPRKRASRSGSSPPRRRNASSRR